MDLFSGSTRGIGQTVVDPNGELRADGKVKSKSIWEWTPISAAIWERHLAGIEPGIGLPPINDNGETKFAALDFDIYQDFDLSQVAKRVTALNFPFVVCRSKSGGAHLFVFFKTFVKCSLLMQKLPEFAAMLNIPCNKPVEIFPRQARLLNPSDTGNWINMPYFNEKQTTRFALNRDGKQLSLLQFLEYAESKRITVADFLAIDTRPEELLPGGPPCLNILCAQGIPEGSRSDALYSLGVYCKKAFPDQWQSKLSEYNRKHMNPPLSDAEVSSTCKSLERKDYQYKCKVPPLRPVCNSTACVRCQHGIGQASVGLPKLGTLLRYDSDPPIFILNAEGTGRMELTVDELNSPALFRKACITQLNTCPIKMPSAGEWYELVAKLLAEVVVVKVPGDVKTEDVLFSHLENFLTSQYAGKRIEDLAQSKPALIDGLHYFRVNDFIDYLVRAGQRDVSRAKLSLMFDRRGVKNGKSKIHGSTVNFRVIDLEIAQAVDAPKGEVC